MFETFRSTRIGQNTIEIPANVAEFANTKDMAEFTASLHKLDNELNGKLVTVDFCRTFNASTEERRTAPATTSHLGFWQKNRPVANIDEESAFFDRFVSGNFDLLPAEPVLPYADIAGVTASFSLAEYPAQVCSDTAALVQNDYVRTGDADRAVIVASGCHDYHELYAYVRVVVNNDWQSKKAISIVAEHAPAKKFYLGTWLKTQVDQAVREIFDEVFDHQSADGAVAAINIGGHTGLNKKSIPEGGPYKVVASLVDHSTRDFRAGVESLTKLWVVNQSVLLPGDELEVETDLGANIHKQALEEISRDCGITITCRPVAPQA